MSLSLYSKASTDTLLAAKLDLAGGTMTGGLTLSASGIIFSDSTYLTTAPAGATLAADQLTAGVVTTNPTSGPTTAGDVLQYNGTALVWAAGGGGGGVAWGAITGTLSSQTDLQTALDDKLALAGGAMDTDAEVTIATTTDRDSLLAGWGLGVQKTSDNTKGTTVSFDGLDTYDGSSHMIISPTGITFPDATTMTTAPAGSALAADQLTAGVVTANPTTGPTTAGDVLQYDGTDLIWAAGGGGGGVAWGAITGTVTDQTDLVTYVTGLGYQTASDVSTYVTANAYPLTGNPSGFLTSVPGKSVYTLTGSYTLAAGDANNIVYCPTNAGGGSTLTITIPDDATYSFAVGTIITLCVDNSSSGTDIVFAPGGFGAPTLVGPIVGPGISATTSGHFYITKIAADRWLLS